MLRNIKHDEVHALYGAEDREGQGNIWRVSTELSSIQA